MLDPEIKNSERLYKAIKKTIPNQWSNKRNGPSSAAFKDSKGLSVDRAGSRPINSIVSDFQSRFEIRSVISVTAGECRNHKTYPKYAPLSDNIYHSEIHRSSDIITLTAGQARKLSKLARIDYP